MTENTKIEWADHTFNPWIGCTKVSPACDHCYAERVSQRMQVQWGAGQTRKRTKAGNWRLPNRWNRQATLSGYRPRVFCASLADVFDKEVPDAWRSDLFRLIAATPHLDWLLLTKRIGNALAMLPADWGQGFANVWLGATVVTQAEADRDVPKLLDVPAAVRFLSCEPLLAPLDLTPWLFPVAGPPTGFQRARPGESRAGLDWIIAGGESGPQARPMHPDWVRGLRDQCIYAGTPFHFKQWGEWAPDCLCSGREAHARIDRPAPGKRGVMFRCGKQAAGRVLDGRTWDEVPA